MATAQQLLYAAVTQCNVMILQADRDNDIERCARRLPDNVRLERHTLWRKMLVEQRRQLESVYEIVYGDNPWKDVAF